jgi:hypothetical protein
MIAVTDLPLAACFGLTLAFGLVAVELDSRPDLFASGIFLGLAMLANGLVPLVLLLPSAWLLLVLLLGLPLKMHFPHPHTAFGKALGRTQRFDIADRLQFLDGGQQPAFDLRNIRRRTARRVR